MVSYDMYGNKIRRPFKMSTKKRAWMKARKSDPNNWRGKSFIKTSFCMNPRCKKKLHWEKRWEFEFDHHDNNPSNNSEKNCWVVCNNCHKKHTVMKTKRGMFGQVTHYKKKVGYKKKTRKKKVVKKKTKRRRSYDPFSGYWP